LAKSATPSSNEFQIAETESFQKQLKKNRSLDRVYRRIRSYVYPLLRTNPFFGPNIKRLKGTFSDYYRYRIGDYRLFYTVNQEEVIVFVVALRHRQDAYETDL